MHQDILTLLRTKIKDENQYYEILKKVTDPEFFTQLKDEIDTLYKSINEFCIKNNAYPFFKDPTNVSECEKTRLDLVRIIPEKIINEFFSVENFGDYYPPKYNKD